MVAGCTGIFIASGLSVGANRSGKHRLTAFRYAPRFPRSAPGSSVSAPPGYILTANDQVAVEVFGEDDLRTNGRLNPEGNLSVPLLGSIHLAGLTLTQAASKLTELYGRDYLVSPKVNVMLLGYAKRRFSILGQVSRPGSYEMPDSSPGGIDLLEAIAMAGGYTRIAAPERITVRRQRRGCAIRFSRSMQSGSQRGAAEVFTSNRVIPSPSGKVFFNRKLFATAPFRAHCSGVESRSS